MRIRLATCQKGARLATPSTPPRWRPTASPTASLPAARSLRRAPSCLGGRAVHKPGSKHVQVICMGVPQQPASVLSSSPHHSGLYMAKAQCASAAGMWRGHLIQQPAVSVYPQGLERWAFSSAAPADDQGSRFPAAIRNGLWNHIEWSSVATAPSFGEGNWMP